MHKLSPRQFRFLLNIYPPYLLAGVHLTHVADDWRELDVEMRLRPWNRNAVGTHFGGSLYSMVDPWYMLLLMRILGPDYVVLDQAASIRFVKPGRGKVHAAIRINDQMLDEIEAGTSDGEAYRPSFLVEILDADGNLVASVDKQIYVRRRQRDSGQTGDRADKVAAPSD